MLAVFVGAAVGKHLVKITAFDFLGVELLPLGIEDGVPIAFPNSYVGSDGYVATIEVPGKNTLVLQEALQSSSLRAFLNVFRNVVLKDLLHGKQQRFVVSIAAKCGESVAEQKQLHPL